MKFCREGKKEKEKEKGKKKKKKKKEKEKIVICRIKEGFYKRELLKMTVV